MLASLPLRVHPRRRPTPWYHCSIANPKQIDDPRLRAYVDMIQGLHRNWTPHEGQIAIGRALFKDNVKDVFVQAGRNFGKTETVAYCVWRWAMSYPGSENYYFAPLAKQAREILWASRRLQTFGPTEWIDGKPNEAEMRIRFTNGSFIKMDGADNVEAYRGIKPKGLSVYDEFKDFRPEFHDAYDPNRAAHNAPLLMIGTPPDREGQFTATAELFRKDPERRYFEFPTETNPHVPKDWLAKKRAELYGRGEGYIWEREYMAKFVQGGASKIFPMLSRSMVTPHAQLMESLHRDRKKLEWILWADPGAATCFAVLFIAINPYTRHIYVLDEVYETDQGKMSVSQIAPRIFATRDELNDRKEWRQGYDEAATWFLNEMLDHFGENFEPSHKAATSKDTGLSLIKDIMLKGLLHISDRCKWFYWEADNYFMDKNGKIPKVNDHLLDAFRYALAAAHYSRVETTEHKPEEHEDFRGARIRDDFPNIGGDDWSDPWKK